MANFFDVSLDDVIQLGPDFDEVWKQLGVIVKNRAKQRQRQAAADYISALTAALHRETDREDAAALMNRIERLLSVLNDPSPRVEP